MIDESTAAKSCVATSNFGAINVMSPSAKTMPNTDINIDIIKIRQMNLFAKFIAAFLSFFSSRSLNIGINDAEITPPITISKSVIGSCVAVR